MYAESETVREDQTQATLYVVLFKTNPAPTQQSKVICGITYSVKYNQLPSRICLEKRKLKMKATLKTFLRKL